MDKMNSQEFLPLLQEFVLRKEAILNMEVRLFVCFIIFECFFYFAYVVKADETRENKKSSLLSISVLLALFFQMTALNGKMGLISAYLRQLECHLQTIGYEGAIWESQVLDTIIFTPGNIFTLSSVLILLLIFFQLTIASLSMAKAFFKNKKYIYPIVIMLLMFLFWFSAKSITVDFSTPFPENCKEWQSHDLFIDFSRIP